MTFLVCDEDYDGITFVDLTSLEIPILDPRLSNYNIEFFATKNDLLNNVPIANTSNYQVEESTTIYVQATNSTTGCSSSVPLNILVELPPQYTDIERFEFCETNDNFVDLSEITPLFELPLSATVFYYRTQQDALLERNGTVGRYQYFTSNETVYVRFEGANGCSYIDSFDIQINPNPVFGIPQDLEACDYDGNGSAVFDFSNLQDSDILNGANASDYTITYHN